MSVFASVTPGTAAGHPARPRRILPGHVERRNRPGNVSGALIVLVIAVACLALPQAACGAPPNPPAVEEANEAEAVPLAEIATEAEAVAARLRDIEAWSAQERAATTIGEQLPALVREIDVRLRESRRIAAQPPSLEILRNLEGNWRRLRRQLSSWTRTLANVTRDLERYLSEVDAARKRWEETLTLAKAEKAPEEVVRRIRSVIAGAESTAASLEKIRGRVLSVQNRVAIQDARARDGLSILGRARENVLGRLLIRDSPPIWTYDDHGLPTGTVREESRESILGQWEALRYFARRRLVTLLVHGALVLILIGALSRATRRLHPRMVTGGGVPAIYNTPVAAGVLFGSFWSPWIYPDAPRLLGIILGGLAVVASAAIARRRFGRNLRPLVYAAAAVYFAEQVRTIAAAVPPLPRLLLFLETLLAGLMLLWLLGSLSRANPGPGNLEGSRTDILRGGSWLGLGLSAIALAANGSGYVTLANVVGSALLGGIYLALVLSALVEVLDGLVAMSLAMRPIALLSLAQRHGELLRRRIRCGVAALAAFVWFLFVLQRLLLRDRVFTALRSFLGAELAVGALRVSVGDVFAFGLTVWAAFLFSRLVRFLLDEDVYPRVRLARGLPYAISTVLHYVIVFAGFFLAVAALGLDMTKVTILAGAFSVGVGFGLQNVFNNFVSGLILLFERPVNVGDVVQIDDMPGVVERIGIRASMIRANNGSMVIVPNGKLISERLVNWSLANRRHGIELPITVQGDDPKRVIALLERIAAAHPLVARDPPPRALVVRLGADSIGIELRAWTDRVEQWMEVRSDLAIAVADALAAEKIGLR